MTPDTLMPIASVTKQFTVGVAGHAGAPGQARLGQAGARLPARLPRERRRGHAARDAARPGDAPHRPAAPRRPLVRLDAHARAAVRAAARTCPSAATSAREFQYNNLMYMTAGLLGGRITGSSGSSSCGAPSSSRSGMKRSSFSLKELTADPDHAVGLPARREAKLVPHPFESAETMGPTGVDQLLRARDDGYLRMMLAGRRLRRQARAAGVRRGRDDAAATRRSGRPALPRVRASAATAWACS